MYIYRKDFRTIAGNPFKILSIYPPYRQGYDKATNTMETFVIKEDEWYRRTWKDGDRQYDKGLPDYKKHKKVYDVKLSLKESQTFTTNKGTELTNEVIMTMSAFLLGEIMKATIAFGKEIPQNNGRDAFDREVKYSNDIINTPVVFSVTGEGIGTKYTFKGVEDFESATDYEELFPEEKKVVEDKTETKTVEVKEEPKKETSEEIEEVEKILGNKEESNNELDELF